MYQYFKEIICPQNETEHIDDNLLADIRQNHDPAGLSCIITTGEVRQSIAHLHANKFSGPDGRPEFFFKCTSEFKVPYLTILFSNILTTGNTTTKVSFTVTRVCVY